ncbi:hypothetical protein [Parafrankia sp. FMc2]|uniref:hypothetical protein n=1 Tax=Parafrankia sp. FMc2 TaxID=3233196 RepID=UPI0034D3A9C3
MRARPRQQEPTLPSTDARMERRFATGHLGRVQRLEKLRTELTADLDRYSEGHPMREHVTMRLTRVQTQLTQAREQVDEDTAAGVRVWGPDDIARDDHVQTGGSRWHRVVRADARTFSIQHPADPERAPLTLLYERITDHRPAARRATA